MISKNEIECLESCLCDIVLHNFQRMIKDCKGNDSKVEYLQNKQDKLLDCIMLFCENMYLENGLDSSKDLESAFNDFAKEAFKHNAKKDLKDILKGSKDSSNGKNTQ